MPEVSGPWGVAGLAVVMAGQVVLAVLHARLSRTTRRAAEAAEEVKHWATDPGNGSMAGHLRRIERLLAELARELRAQERHANELERRMDHADVRLDSVDDRLAAFEARVREHLHRIGNEIAKTTGRILIIERKLDIKGETE